MHSTNNITNPAEGQGFGIKTDTSFKNINNDLSVYESTNLYNNHNTNQSINFDNMNNLNNIDERIEENSFIDDKKLYTEEDLNRRINEETYACQEYMKRIFSKEFDSQNYVFNQINYHHL